MYRKGAKSTVSILFLKNYWVLVAYTMVHLALDDAVVVAFVGAAHKHEHRQRARNVRWD